MASSILGRDEVTCQCVQHAFASCKNQERYQNQKRCTEWLLEQIEKLHETGDIVMHTSSSTATIVKPNKRLKIKLDSNSDQWINVEDIKDGKRDKLLICGNSESVKVVNI